MTKEMYLHCLKHTPKELQNELTNNKDKVEAIIVLSNWNTVYGCFNCFDDMYKFVDKYDKQASDKGHWSFEIIQVNPNADFDSISIWDNEEYIR
jgi:hypothetical protein